MSKVPQGVVWPDDGRTTHCLVISPTFFYHAKAGNASRGAWKKTPDAERKYGEEIELFYRESNLWRYLGTYRCIGNAPSALPKIRKLGPQYASNVIKETIQDRKAIPPVVANTIEQMYDMAVLQAVCSGWLRIGYNRDLAGALPSRVDCSASSSKQAQGPPNSIVPKKRAIGEEFGGGRRKRSKAR
ncbi:hypothetical protein BV20DRAFT_494591 [Pilatotrama ljubarskyi]|nr:hypothetical protein BV20DRAFT_494591 [Pilatotrama ljubarskyi]